MAPTGVRVAGSRAGLPQILARLLARGQAWLLLAGLPVALCLAATATASGNATATATTAASATPVARAAVLSRLGAGALVAEVTLEAPPERSNDATPSFRGTATGAATVTVVVYSGASAGGKEIARLKAQPSAGSWATASVSPQLPDGRYTAVATQPAGAREEATSAPVHFTVDTQPPSVTLEAPPSPTRDRTPSFSGTASEATAVTVEVFEGPRPEGKIVASIVAPGARGSWSSGALPTPLPGGVRTFTAIAIQESEIKNEPGRSTPVSFVIDTEAPTVTLEPLPSPSNLTTPSFSGTASESTPVSISVYEGPSAQGEVVASTTVPVSGGSFSSQPLVPPLPSGVHTFTAVANQHSALGNPDGISAPITFVTDTLAPRVTLNALPSPTANRSPSFSGTGSDHTPVLVSVYAGGAAEGIPVASVTAEVDRGRWASARASLPALPWGQYTAVASQASSIGNADGVSPPIAFAVEPIAPTVATAAASSVTRSAAALYGSVDPHAAPISRCYFEYGTSASYGRNIECGFVSEMSTFPEAASGPVAVFARIYGLSAATTYHVRLVALGEGGTGWGPDRTFTTLSPYVFDEGQQGVAVKPPGPAAAPGAGLAASIAEALVPRGRRARIAELLRRGLYALRFVAPGAGRVTLGWYYRAPVARGAHSSARAPVLVAGGTRVFHAPGNGEIKLRLTAAGRRLLSGASWLRLTATGVFTALGGPATRASAAFALRR